MHPAPSAVFDAVVCDRLPPYTSFVAAPGATYRHGQACWYIPYLAVGHTEDFSRRGADQRHRAADGIVNTATVVLAQRPAGARPGQGPRPHRAKPRSGGVTG